MLRRFRRVPNQSLLRDTSRKAKKTGLPFLTVMLLCLVHSESAWADIVITFSEAGNNVLASYEGTLDLSDLEFTSGNSAVDRHRIRRVPNGTDAGTFINTFETQAGRVSFSAPFSSIPTTAWMTGSDIDADSFGGNHFLLSSGGTAAPLMLQSADLSGSMWSGSGFMEFENTTLAAMGIDLSSNPTWVVNNASADRISMTAVPEPTGLFAIVFIGFIVTARRRSNA